MALVARQQSSFTIVALGTPYSGGPKALHSRGISGSEAAPAPWMIGEINLLVGLLGSAIETKKRGAPDLFSSVASIESLSGRSGGRFDTNRCNTSIRRIARYERAVIT
jgi:hypothetical protein